MNSTNYFFPCQTEPLDLSMKSSDNPPLSFLEQFLSNLRNQLAQTQTLTNIINQTNSSASTTPQLGNSSDSSSSSHQQHDFAHIQERSYRQFQCNQCSGPSSQSFSKVADLKEHTIKVHGCYRCHICHKEFTQRCNLLRHCVQRVGFNPCLLYTSPSPRD